MKAKPDSPLKAMWDERTRTVAFAVEGAGAVAFAPDGTRTFFDAHGVVKRSNSSPPSRLGILLSAWRGRALFFKDVLAR